MLPLSDLQKSLRAKASPAKAKLYASFFKTAPGQYGHGDIFLGLTAPEQRSIAKNFYHLPLADIQKLLKSKIHEERFTALVILVHQFTYADKCTLSPSARPARSTRSSEAGGEGAHGGEGETTQKQIYTFYLKNATRVNNWDLVDTSAPQIVGDSLINKPKNILTKLARSPNLWERRIAILATLTFIRHNEFKETIHLAKLLLNDQHDLIHKAVGWMLREVGKKSEPTLKKFLNNHHRAMPRTMLRYAIEKLSKTERKKYLKK